MHASQPVPGALDRALQEFLNTRMPPSSSRVPPIYRETTICHAYMCSYAYACTEKTARPAQVLMRRCLRYVPESMRPRPALSDLALDLLARRRESGELLAPATAAILDQFRPNGPLRKQA